MVSIRNIIRLNSRSKECSEISTLLWLAVTEVNEMPSLVLSLVVDVSVDVSISTCIHVNVRVSARIIVKVSVGKYGEISISKFTSICVIRLILCGQSEQ